MKYGLISQCTKTRQQDVRVVTPGKSIGFLRRLFSDLKMTDWVALAAFVISLWFGIFGPLLADSNNPTIDIAPPNIFQFTCTPIPEKKSDGSYPCADDAMILVTANLFSFWNTSKFSTKEEIVMDVQGTLILHNERIPLNWSYFTELTDIPGPPKQNAARFILAKGDLRNREIQFSIDSNTRWSTLAEAIRAEGMARVEFLVEMQHTPNKAIECAFALAPLRAQLQHFFVVVRQVECN